MGIESDQCRCGGRVSGDNLARRAEGHVTCAGAYSGRDMREFDRSRSLEICRGFFGILHQRVSVAVVQYRGFRYQYRRRAVDSADGQRRILSQKLNRSRLRKSADSDVIVRHLRDMNDVF